LKSIYNQIWVMLLFNPPLVVRMVTKVLWRAFQSLHSPSNCLIIIFSFVVVEDIYRRRQPFLSMDAIYILHPTNKREVTYFSLQTYTDSFSLQWSQFMGTCHPDSCLHTMLVVLVLSYIFFTVKKVGVLTIIFFLNYKLKIIDVICCGKNIPIAILIFNF
jgi:hypothetical protein